MKKKKEIRSSRVVFGAKKDVPASYCSGCNGRKNGKCWYFYKYPQKREKFIGACIYIPEEHDKKEFPKTNC